MSDSNQSVNSLLNNGFLNQSTIEDQEPHHSPAKSSADYESKHLDIVLNHRHNKSSFEERIKSYSSIKKRNISTNLSESDLKDFSAICLRIANKENETPEFGQNIRHNKKIIQQTEELEEESLKNEQKLEGPLPRLPVSQPCDKIRIRDLKNNIIKQIGHSGSSDTCPICLQGFSSNHEESRSLVILDPCNHVLCKSCILEWVRKYKSNCPTCRQSFTNLWPLESVGCNELLRGDLPIKFTPMSKEWQLEDDDFYNEGNDGSSDTCQLCNRAINFNLMIICDECNFQVCHKSYCDPALKGNHIPDDEWYCMTCRADRICYNVSSTEIQTTRETNQTRVRNPNRSRENYMLRNRQRPNYLEEELENSNFLNQFQYQNTQTLRRQRDRGLQQTTRWLTTYGTRTRM